VYRAVLSVAPTGACCIFAPYRGFAPLTPGYSLPSLRDLRRNLDAAAEEKALKLPCETVNLGRIL
jgi:hypothetical protein